MISILDYGVGNVQAFVNAYKRLNVPCNIVKNRNELQNAEKIILPGIGNFDFAINQLNQSDMREMLDDLVMNKKIPVLGVCVGMQMMAQGSEEGKEKGLNWVDGFVRKLETNKIKQIAKLPHLGWNTIGDEKKSPILYNLNKDSSFYFLHSYYFECQDESNIMAYTNYGIHFPSVISHQNIFGIQFHPEKSHDCGHQILSNFATLKLY